MRDRLSRSCLALQYEIVTSDETRIVHCTKSDLTTRQAAFHQMMADAMTRFASFSEDVAALEHQMLTRAQGAVASWAQLTQDAIAYGAQLSAQARKLGLETARKFQAS